MSSELAIIKQENIQTIVSAAPQSYNDNKLSCERCISAGNPYSIPLQLMVE